MSEPQDLAGNENSISYHRMGLSSRVEGDDQLVDLAPVLFLRQL